jgi:hypothetical protein
MKQSEIKVGVTYRGKRGKTRTVTAIKQDFYGNVTVHFNRKEPWNNVTTGSMFLPYFASWAKEIVDEL